jgi:hypothetical protein
VAKCVVQVTLEVSGEDELDIRFAHVAGDPKLMAILAAIVSRGVEGNIKSVEIEKY